MVLDSLSNSLKNTLQKIAKAVFVDETLVNELIKDIQRALLQADVNVKLVFELTERIKQRALKEDASKGLTKKEQLVNIVYEELTRFIGGEQAQLRIGARPFRIMLVGLYGSGKTTSAGKLAKFLQKRGHTVALLGLDVHRPAAMAQLEQVSVLSKTPCFVDKSLKDPVEIYKKFEKKLSEFDVVLIDTSGRDALSDDLINELKSLSSVIKPNESLLVMSADIGQTAKEQASAFKVSTNISGVILTKMDGTAKGGGALSACAVTGAPILFIGLGEKLDDFEPFNPKGFVGRILGMGDIESLLEKAKEAISEEEAKDLEKKLLKGEFNLLDLYNQMEAMSKMGPLGKIMELIPGLGQLALPKDVLKVQEGKLKYWRHAMDSMTKAELEDPEIMDANRIERIAKGSGVPVTEIRDLLKQYRQGKKMVKLLKGGSPDKLMKKLSQANIQLK